MSQPHGCMTTILQIFSMWNFQDIIQSRKLSFINVFDLRDYHCVKSVQMRSFFWSAFSCIWTEYRKIRTIKNSVFGHFSQVFWKDAKTIVKLFIFLKFRNSCIIGTHLKGYFREWREVIWFVSNLSCIGIAFDVNASCIVSDDFNDFRSFFLTIQLFMLMFMLMLMIT